MLSHQQIILEYWSVAALSQHQTLCFYSHNFWNCSMAWILNWNYYLLMFLYFRMKRPASEVRTLTITHPGAQPQPTDVKKEAEVDKNQTVSNPWNCSINWRKYLDLYKWSNIKLFNLSGIFILCNWGERRGAIWWAIISSNNFVVNSGEKHNQRNGNHNLFCNSGKNL